MTHRTTVLQVAGNTDDSCPTVADRRASQQYHRIANSSFAELIADIEQRRQVFVAHAGDTSQAERGLIIFRSSLIKPRCKSSGFGTEPPDSCQAQRLPGVGQSLGGRCAAIPPAPAAYGTIMPHYDPPMRGVCWRSSCHAAQVPPWPLERVSCRGYCSLSSTAAPPRYLVMKVRSWASL